MKELNNIDDMFQQHFAETTVPMSNQEELWQRIAKKKDDRGIGFWWSGLMGLGLLILSGVLLYGFTKKDEINISDNNIASVTNYQNSDNPENRSEIVTPILEEKTERKVEEKNIDKAIGELKKEEKSNQIIIPTEKKVNFSNKVIETEVGSNNVIAQEIIPIQNVEAIESNSASAKIEETSIANTKSATNLGSFGFRDLNSDGLKDFKVPYDESWDQCEVKEQGHFFADVYGQGGLPMDEIGFSQEGSDQFAVRDLWDMRFTPKASWHAGAQVGYEWPSSFRLSAGAEYQEIVTEYADNQRVTEVIRVWDPQAFFEIDMNGDRVWVGDTVTAINVYDRRFVRKNKHTLLHIPVQVGYDIYKRPGFHIGLDVSAALNISKSYEGQFIRSDQTLIIVDDANQDNYMSKDIGISFSAGLHFGKYLNEDWEVYASPRFRYNPNSYLLDTETLKVTRNFMGIRLGVRRHF